MGGRERIWERWEEMVPGMGCEFGGRYGGEGGGCDWEGEVEVGDTGMVMGVGIVEAAVVPEVEAEAAREQMRGKNQGPEWDLWISARAASAVAAVMRSATTWAEGWAGEGFLGSGIGNGVSGGVAEMSRRGSSTLRASDNERTWASSRDWGRSRRTTVLDAFW